MAKMQQELYARVVRGILHSDSSSEDREPLRTYELIERLKQVVWLDEDAHQKILNDNENCVEYWVNVRVVGDNPRRFMLQVARAANRTSILKEHVLETNKDYFLAICDTRHAVLRLFPADTDSPSSPNSGDERDRDRVQRSSSFLRRWVRTHGRSQASLTLRVKELALGERLERRVDDETLLFITLKRRLVSGADFDPIDTEELLQLMRVLYRDRFADNEFNDDQVAVDQTKRILARVAKFYSIPSTQMRLLSVGLALEQQLNRNSFEVASELIRRSLSKLRAVSLVKDPVAVAAAVYLRQQIVSHVGRVIARQPETLFLPVGCESSTMFLAFSHCLSPVLELCSLNLWEKTEVVGIKEDVCALFQTATASAANVWLRSLEDQPMDANFLCGKVDALHLCLRRFAPHYDAFFDRAFFRHSEFVLQLIDAPLLDAVKRVLEFGRAATEPRNRQKLVSFTKSTMKLFDALRQLIEFTDSLAVHKLTLKTFESYFEPVAVLWTCTWRSVYLNFVRKSIEVAEEGGGPPPPSPAPTEEKQLFFQTKKTAEARELDLHPATVNCIAFCKSLCDDYLRLNVQGVDTMLLCSLRIVNTLADCLTSFAFQLRTRLKQDPTCSKMVRTANGIEHAASHVAQHFERLLELKRLYAALPEHECTRIKSAVDHIMQNALSRCRCVADEVVHTLADQKTALLRKQWDSIVAGGDSGKRTFKFYMKQVFVPERTDQVFVVVEKIMRELKTRLVPRLFELLQSKMWEAIRLGLHNILQDGQPPDYYETVDKECAILCRLLGVDWSRENSALRRKIHANCAETRELILQYYGRLADLTMSAPVREGVPRVSIKAGYIPSTNQQILLHVQIVCAYDIPVLDSLTNSSDPYLRMELYPRAFFPLSMFPPATTETRKKTLNPRWNSVFQMAVPEEYFFTNGACLCLTVLDHDVMSYNDLAGQALLPLHTVPRLQSLSPRQLPPPIVLPLALPQPAQYTEAFKILEQRSARDPLARELTYYERYIRDYRILPPGAMDDKECVMHNRLTLARNRQRLKQAIHSFIVRS